jgi:hypothetical protein
VKSIRADKGNPPSTKAALDLLEAIKFATNKGPVDWEKELVNQVVEILQTHSVRPGNPANFVFLLVPVH